ncbi:MAG: DNA polymerase III subunit chi [Alphaproteobacteria bacterium]|nr:DNA polymerase III subunit chi [Alphaproteobacteria bacterium]
MEVNFYHLTRQPLPLAASRLVGLARSRGMKVAVACETIEFLQDLSEALWKHTQDYWFLGHCTDASGLSDQQARLQKIWLTQTNETPNQPEILLLCENRQLQGFALNGVQRVLDIFDGKDELALTQARARFRLARSNGSTVNYYAQKESGSWYQPKFDKKE